MLKWNANLDIKDNFFNNWGRFLQAFLFWIALLFLGKNVEIKECFYKELQPSLNFGAYLSEEAYGIMPFEDVHVMWYSPLYFNINIFTEM